MYLIFLPTQIKKKLFGTSGSKICFKDPPLMSLFYASARKALLDREETSDVLFLGIATFI